MLKIGLLGADNFHALAFAKLANFPANLGGSGLDVSINAIFGESRQRAEFVSQQANIPLIVENPHEMLNIVDAVMIVTRIGENHLKEAAPFIKKGLPVWIDKPFACSIEIAQDIITMAEKYNVFLAGGSFCKYCPDVLSIKNKLEKIGGVNNIFGAHFNFPAKATDTYGGFHFYAPHTAEILATVFGSDILSIKADDTNGNAIAIFKYKNFSVSVNFAQVSDFSCIIYGKSQVIQSKIDISDIYRHGFEKIVNSIVSQKMPESINSLLWPVKIVNALIKAHNSNEEIFI